MKKLLLAVAVLAIFGGLLFLLFREPEREAVTEYIATSNEQEDFEEAKKLVTEGNFAEASSLVARHTQDLTREGVEKWVELEIPLMEALYNGPRLLYLFKQMPSAFEGFESTIIFLQRLLLLHKEFENFQEVREGWRGKEKDTVAWFFVDADFLMLTRDFDGAIAHLQSEVFEGVGDIPRLVRLAIVQSKDDLSAAWKTLSDAYAIDPTHSEVRSFRGRILEHVDQPHLARIEYSQAWLMDPKNSTTLNQLAEFYRRHHDYKQALITWGHGLKNNSADYVWLKSWFWSHLVTPIEFDWVADNVPQGRHAPLVRYLIGLEEGQWWNDEAFSQIPETSLYIQGRQETFWLQLLDALKTGKEADAARLLTSTQFRGKFWAPELAGALSQVLDYRLKGVLLESSVKNAAESLTNDEPLTKPLQKKHHFFLTLDQLARAEESELEPWEEFLRGPEVFSALFLASGWPEAALQFNFLTTIPESYPDWYIYGLTQAYAANRDATTALAFAERQKRSDPLDIFVSELMIRVGRAEEGIEGLRRFSNSGGSLGFRANLILAGALTDGKRFDDARTVIESHEELRGHLSGQELLARIAYLEGDLQQADEIYDSIKEQSFFALSYLAKRAFEKKDYARAKEMTLKMIQVQPDALHLRSSLQLIENTAKKANE